VKIFVVIPTYNERANIEKLITEVLAQDIRIRVLIIDDNSPDGTGEIVSNLTSGSDRIFLLRRTGKLGLGSAYREGFRIALEKGAHIVIQMDADFSHDPKCIPAMIKGIDEQDLIIGSRYMTGVSVVNWPIRRLLLSYSANVYTRIVTGLRMTDCTSGFKCFRGEVLKEIDLNKIRSDGYSFQIEMNYRCMEKGFRIGEIPIIFIDRHAGTSKMSKRIVREAVLMVWKLKVGSFFRRFTEKRESCDKRGVGIIG